MKSRKITLGVVTTMLLIQGLRRSWENWSDILFGVAVGALLISWVVELWRK